MCAELVSTWEMLLAVGVLCKVSAAQPILQIHLASLVVASSVALDTLSASLSWSDAHSVRAQVDDPNLPQLHYLTAHSEAAPSHGTPLHLGLASVVSPLAAAASALSLLLSGACRDRCAAWCSTSADTPRPPLLPDADRLALRLRDLTVGAVRSL